MTTYLKPHHKIHRNKESQSNHKRRFGFNFPISAHQKKNQRHFCRRKTFFEYFSCFVGHKMWLFIGFWVHLWFKWRIKVCIVIGSKWVILEGLPVFFLCSPTWPGLWLQLTFQLNILFNCYHQSTNAARWTEFKEEADIR